jgi:nitrite reductase/ring-hydroxylating ferredoxin subunit
MGACGVRNATEKDVAHHHHFVVAGDLLERAAQMFGGILIIAGEPLDGRMLAGRVGDNTVLLARRGEIFAVDLTCSHYAASLADGLMVGDTVRCPWHHACFSVRTGEALCAPAFGPLTCWAVEERDGHLIVRAKPITGAQAPHVYVLRSLIDCENLIAAAQAARPARDLGGQLYRPRGCGRLARAGPRSPCRGPRGAADAAPAGAATRGLGAIPASGARRDIPS